MRPSPLPSSRGGRISGWEQGTAPSAPAWPGPSSRTSGAIMTRRSRSSISSAPPPAGGPGAADRRQRLTGLLICAEAHLGMSHAGHASAVLDEIASCRDALELFRPVRIRWLHLMSRLERSRGSGAAAEALSRTALAMAQRCGLDCEALDGRDHDLVAAPGPRPEAPGRREGRPGAANENNPAMPEDGCPFVTGDRGMISTLERIRQAAPFPVPVLLTGESGVGKEVVARLIHRWSGRGALPFIPVNAAALPPRSFRKRAVRPRTRGVHRRRKGKKGTPRNGRKRDHLSRRDRGIASRAAGEAAAISRQRGVLCGRRRHGDEERGKGHRRHEQGS